MSFLIHWDGVMPSFFAFSSTLFFISGVTRTPIISSFTFYLFNMFLLGLTFTLFNGVKHINNVKQYLTKLNKVV